MARPFERTIQAPPEEWLTLDQIVLWLNHPKTTLERYITIGKFPRGQKAGKELRWHWTTVVAWAWLRQAGFSAVSDPSSENSSEAD